MRETSTIIPLPAFLAEPWLFPQPQGKQFPDYCTVWGSPRLLPCLCLPDGTVWSCMQARSKGSWVETGSFTGCIVACPEAGWLELIENQDEIICTKLLILIIETFFIWLFSQWPFKRNSAFLAHLLSVTHQAYPWSFPSLFCFFCFTLSFKP